MLGVQRVLLNDLRRGICHTCVELLPFFNAFWTKPFILHVGFFNYLIERFAYCIQIKKVFIRFAEPCYFRVSIGK